MSESFSALLDESLSTLDMQPGSIVSGVVLDVDNDWVTVHVGLKSEADSYTHLTLPTNREV